MPLPGARGVRRRARRPWRRRALRRGPRRERRPASASARRRHRSPAAGPRGRSRASAPASGRRRDGSGGRESRHAARRRARIASRRRMFPCSGPIDGTDHPSRRLPLAERSGEEGQGVPRSESLLCELLGDSGLRVLVAAQPCQPLIVDRHGRVALPGRLLDSRPLLCQHGSWQLVNRCGQSYKASGPVRQRGPVGRRLQSAVRRSRWTSISPKSSGSCGMP